MVRLGGSDAILFILSDVHPVVGLSCILHIVLFLCQWVIYLSVLVPNYSVMFVMRLITNSLLSLHETC
jgi:hypothetical protein